MAAQVGQPVSQPPEVKELSIPASSFRKTITHSSSAEWKHSSEARNVNSKYLETPESPYGSPPRAVTPTHGAAAGSESPRDVLHAWSDRNGPLGPGLPKQAVMLLPPRPNFKRAACKTGSMAACMPPVLSAPPKSPRKRRPSAERQPMGLGGWSPLHSTPEGSQCEVSAVPLQACVMFTEQDQMLREQAEAEKEGELLLSRLAAVLQAPSAAPSRRVVHFEQRSAATSRPSLPGAVQGRSDACSCSPPRRNTKPVPQRAAAIASSPWTCFVDGVHALIGCKLQD